MRWTVDRGEQLHPSMIQTGPSNLWEANGSCCLPADPAALQGWDSDSSCANAGIVAREIKKHARTMDTYLATIRLLVQLLHSRCHNVTELAEYK
jgi:hypothetical protein